MRSIISDFAVFFTILTMVLIDYALGVPSPKLKVPSVFKVNCSTQQKELLQDFANKLQGTITIIIFYKYYFNTANQR